MRGKVSRVKWNPRLRAQNYTDESKEDFQPSEGRAEGWGSSKTRKHRVRKAWCEEFEIPCENSRQLLMELRRDTTRFVFLNGL